jgi:integrase
LEIVKSQCTQPLKKPPSAGKEKWTSLRTKLLTVARNRMKEHVGAAERQRTAGTLAEPTGRMEFAKAVAAYRQKLADSTVRPNTKSYREAGLKLLLKSWPEIESVSVRRITSKMVETWLQRFYTNAKPHVPPGAKAASHNSTGASATTIKCALDAVRLVLDVAVESGHLYANPARNSTVTDTAKRLLKATRREKAERPGSPLPTKDEFQRLVAAVENAGVSDCKAAADYIQFIALCGARKTEAVNVLWLDIDFERSTIHLRVTKNGEPRRVPMLTEMRALLDRMRGDGKSISPADTVLRVREAQGFINSSCRTIGITRFTTHALRHLFGTACLEAGVDVRTVASWLGHKDNGALLLKVYSHVRQQDESEMIQKVSFGFQTTKSRQT